MTAFKKSLDTRNFLSIAALGIGVGVLASPAAAQESAWSGFYVGANAGVTWSDSQADVAVRTIGNAPVVTPPIVVPPSDITAINSAAHFDSKHHTGFTGGAEAGYNYVMDGGLLLGIETDISVYDITGGKANSVNIPVAGPTPYAFSLTQTVDTDFLWTLRPRIGYAMDNILVFATGGLALTTTNYQARLVDSRTSANTVLIDNDSKTKTGWTIGGGAAYAFTPNISLKGEYLFQNFGHTDFSGTSTNGYLGYDVDIHLKSHMFRAGLDYRF